MFVYFYRNSKIGYELLRIPKYLYEMYLIKIASDKRIIQKQYLKRNGGYLNIEKPKTFNDKLQWLKLYDRTPLHTICADKLAVREYISQKIGDNYLIPLINVVNKIRDLDFNLLPDFAFIIKTNHGSGGVYIVNDKNKIDLDEIKRRLKYDLSSNFFTKSREWQYLNIKPKIFIEKLLLTKDGNIPPDYKFFCFNGKVEFIAYDTDRFEDHKRFFYDKYWNILPFFYGDKEGYQNYYKDRIPSLEGQPPLLDEMIQIAEKLAADFRFVRVDLYSVDNKIYFGELTFHPDAGYGSFYPDRFNEIYGNKLSL